MPSQTREERTIAHAAAQLAAVGETVEVLALTTDESLLATLRQSVGNRQRVWHAADREQAIELIMAGRVGVIVVDGPATGGESAAFCEQLRAQFPDLVLMVAGGADEQTHLVKQITSGDIYRFLHKPVSTARARQFMETAVRRYLEGRTFTPAETAPAAPARNLKVLIGIGAAVLSAVAIAIALFLSSGQDDTDQDDRYRQASADPTADSAPPAPAPSAPTEESAAAEPVATSTPEPAGLASPDGATAAPQPQATVEEMLAQANAALAQGQLVAPPGASALELYQAVLAREEGNRDAQAGLDTIADQLLGNAETAMLEERVDDAARDIEAARSVRPNNVRLAFLSAQLAKERERRTIALAREAAAKGNHARARVLIERAMQNQRAPSPVLAEARKEMEQLKRGDSVGNLLQLANERLKQDRLVEPANDNARSYIEAALAADPSNATALQARRALADRLLARGRQAIAARDPVVAGSWLSQAEAMSADRAALRAAQRDLQILRQTSARSDQVARLAGLMTARIGEDRVLEPTGDSAAHYWRELRALDAAHAALPPALQTIGARLVQHSRQSIAAEKFDDAQRALDEARRLGFAPAELTALDRELGAARERSAFLANVVPANRVARQKQVEPRYPANAQRRGLEGWVDMDFTIAADGRVKDILVRGSEPAGVFEDAATRAVTQWVFRPVMRNGLAVEQRARLRLQFTISEPTPAR